MLVPTARLLLFALVGTLPMVLFGSPGAAVIVAIVWLLFVTGVGFYDATLMPAKADLIWTREYEPVLSLGVRSPVALRLTNRSRREAVLKVRDSVDLRLNPSGETGSGRCTAGETWDLHYYVRPDERGDHAFGSVSARYLGPLGLVWRQYPTPLAGTVKVYPDLRAVRSYETLARRAQLQEMGLRRTRRRGPGTEFERLRDYAPDDEYRRINWAATARRHTPITVDYQTERSQSVIVVLDAGRRMSLRIRAGGTDDDAENIDPGDAQVADSPVLTRLDYAVNAALLLAFVSLQYGDRVGLVAFTDRVVRHLPPRSGRYQFLALTESLYNVRAEAAEADYAIGLGYLAAHDPQRSLVIIFTDLVEPESTALLVGHAAHLARRHVVLVVTLDDPEVARLAGLRPAASRPLYERAVARDLLDARAETLHRLRGQGVLTLDVSAEKLSPALINQYLAIKARGML